MAKFAKRLRKLSRNTVNALVVGKAFGHLDQLLQIYNNVFVIDDELPSIKSRNLVYSEDFAILDHVGMISGIFVDEDKITKIELLESCWNRHKSPVFVQGNNYKDIHLSQIFYRSGWGCTSEQGIYHVWEKIK